jgi:hypothetical protein
MTNQEKEIEILRKVESGELSAADALALLKNLDTSAETERVFSPAVAEPAAFVAAPPAPVEELFRPTPPTPVVPPVMPSTPMTPAVRAERVAGQVEPDERELAREIARWKRWWMIPFWVGVVITIGGAALVYWGYTATRFGWGFWLAWPPFLFGLLIMIIGWQSQKSRWLHVRIRQKPGEKPGTIVISMPLPLRLAAWFLRHFAQYIPEVRGKGLDEMLAALEKSVSPDAPFYVNVNDEDGEHVEVYIG